MNFRLLREGVEIDSLGNQLTPEQSIYFANSKVRDSKGRLLVVHHGTYNTFDSFAQGDIGFHFGTEKSANDRRNFVTHSWDAHTKDDWKVGKYHLNITNPFKGEFDYESYDGVSIAAVWLFGTSYDGLIEFVNDDKLGETYIPREFSDARSVEIIKDVVRRFAPKYDDWSSIPRDAEPNVIMRNLFKSKGYDGIEYVNAFEGAGDTSYIAFEPEQIKLITNKTPTSSRKMHEGVGDNLPSIEEVESLFSQLGYDKDYQINHSAFIFPDGKIFFNNTHEDFYIELCDRGIIDDYYEDFIVTKFNCIRCCDIDGYEHYIELPKSVTLRQIRTLTDWADHSEEKYGYNIIQLCSRNDGFDEKVYDLDKLRREGEDPVEYIINRVKRFYSSGKLYEEIDDTEVEHNFDSSDIFTSFTDKMMSKFNSMSSDEILSYLMTSPRTDIDVDSPMFILPNGKIVSVFDVLKKNGLMGELEPTHNALPECFGWVLMSELGYSADEVAEISDNWRLDDYFDEMLNELTHRHNWARINCGKTWMEDRFYCVLPNKVTPSQFNTLEEWMDWGFDNGKDNVLVFVTDNHIAKTYSMAEDFPDGVIKKIKRFYSSGKFYESAYTDDNEDKVGIFLHGKCDEWCVNNFKPGDEIFAFTQLWTDWGKEPIDGQDEHLIHALIFRDNHYIDASGEYDDIYDLMCNFDEDPDDCAFYRFRSVNDFKKFLDDKLKFKTLRVDLNEKIEHMTVDEDSSDYDELFVVDSVQELKYFMDTTDWDEFKIIDSSHYDGNYYIGNALSHIHSNILKNAVDGGWFPDHNRMSIQSIFSDSDFILIERGKDCDGEMFGIDWYDYKFIFEDYTILARDDISDTELIKKFGKLIEVQEYEELEEKVISNKEVISTLTKKWKNYMSEMGITSKEAREHILDKYDEEDIQKIVDFVSSLKFPLKVYRGLKSYGNSFKVNIDKPGAHWTTDPKLFTSSNSSFRNVDHIIVGYVDEDDIDWGTTIDTYAHYSLRPDYNRYPEMEVTLKRGAKPKNITEVDKGSLLNESLQKLASNAFITDSPYQIRDLLFNKPKLYRILYDSNIDKYMIGDGEEVIHWDLIKAARKHGYYAEMEEFIDELGDLENYVEFGEGGQFLDDEEIESYLIYMVYSPDEDTFVLGEDGYQFRYTLKQGVMFTRDSYLEDCDLYRVLKAGMTTNTSTNDLDDTISEYIVDSVNRYTVGSRLCEEELPKDTEISQKSKDNITKNSTNVDIKTDEEKIQEIKNSIKVSVTEN